MPKSTLTDSQLVTAHIRKLDPKIGKVVEALRKIILKTDPSIGERIKWNNLSATIQVR